MSSQNIIYVDSHPSIGYVIGIFGLQCLIVFGFLFCCGFCFCRDGKTSKIRPGYGKFKISKYKELNSVDEAFFKIYVPPKSASLTQNATTILNVLQTTSPEDSVQNNLTNIGKDKIQDDEKSLQESKDIEQKDVEQKKEIDNSPSIEQKFVDNTVKCSTNTNLDLIKSNQPTDTLGRKICRTLTCGYLCKKHTPSSIIGEDIENKKKRYLLYKFNNLNAEESMDDPSKYMKSDPYVNLKDFAKIVYDVYDPSDVEILLHISSPGGYAYKFEEIYSYIDRLKKKGFVITAVIDDFCASGGYMLASACSKIVASPYSQIGSVGVICTAFNWHDLSKKIGVTQKTFKTGSDKEGFPSGDEITQEDIDRMQNRINDTLKIFKGMVQRARNLTDQEMEEILTAKVWYGEEAMNKKLIDTVSLSLDYFSGLSANGDIYLVTCEPQKKTLLNGLMRLVSLPDIIENTLSDKYNAVNMLKLE